MRYFVKKQRPKLWDVDDSDVNDIPMIHNITIYEDNEIILTGIIDMDGNEICRTDKEPIGFLSEILE